MSDSTLVILIVSVAGTLAVLAGLGALGRKIFQNPRGDFEMGFAFLVAGVYARLVHRVRVRGEANISAAARGIGAGEGGADGGRPDRDGWGGEGPGPLIVACNHTAGVDPVLVQVQCPFMIRWLMASNMRVPWLDWFWDWVGVLFVDRNGGSASLRVALRHLRAGGVVGIFPEGGIERPPQQIMPFHTGVGMLVKRSGARVLPVTIDGTPQVDPAWSSLWRPSTAVVHFHEPIEYGSTEMSAEEIADDLRRRFQIYTGWEFNPHPAEEDEGDVVYYGRVVSRA